MRDGNNLPLAEKRVNQKRNDEPPESWLEQQPPIDLNCPEFGAEYPLQDGNAPEHPIPHGNRNVTGKRPSAKSEPFRFIPLAEMKVVAPDFLIRNMLEKNTLSVIFGDSTSGKTFCSIDIACCISTGTDFHGRQVCESGPVIYIAGEGQSGIARRFKAWSVRHGIGFEDIPVMVSVVPGQLTDSESADSIIAAIGAMPEKPRLIVLDTLARNFGPGDENSTSDMGKFVQSVDRIRQHSDGATVLIVHHVGLSDKTRSRGSSVLRGAIDSEYRFYSDEHGIRRLENIKMKDSQEPEPMAFKLRSVEIGLSDEYGEPVTSAVLDDIEYTEPPKTNAGRGKNQTRAMDALTLLISEHRENLKSSGYDPDQARVLVKDWKTKCNMDYSAFKRVSDSLQKNGHIKISGDYVSQN